jgi:hypothetical protein
VDTEDSQSIINFYFLYEFNCSKTKRSGTEPNYYGWHCPDETGSWSNGDQTCYSPGGRPDRTRFSSDTPGEYQPSHHRRCGRGIRDNEGVHGCSVYHYFTSCVKAEPTEPQQAGTQYHHRHVGRAHRLLEEPNPLADH